MVRCQVSPPIRRRSLWRTRLRMGSASPPKQHVGHVRCAVGAAEIETIALRSGAMAAAIAVYADAGQPAEHQAPVFQVGDARGALPAPAPFERIGKNAARRIQQIRMVDRERQQWESLPHLLGRNDPGARQVAGGELQCGAEQAESIAHLRDRADSGQGHNDRDQPPRVPRPVLLCAPGRCPLGSQPHDRLSWPGPEPCRQ